jgi:hypothetical protein
MFQLTGPHFAWFPHDTRDQGRIWLRPYWNWGFHSFANQDEAFRRANVGTIVAQAEEKRRRETAERGGIDIGPWLDGGDNELVRVYAFPAGPGSTTKVQLHCRLTYEEQKIKPFVYLVFDPYLSEQTTYSAAIFGPSDDLLNYEVLTAKLEAAASGITFVVFDISNGPQLLDILMLGRQLTLRLILSSGETIASLPFENDASFRTEYELLASRLSA